MKLALSLCLAFASPFAGGSLPNNSPSGGDTNLSTSGLATWPMEQQAINDALAAAAQIDAGAAATLAGKVAQGDIGVAYIWSSDGPPGSHDSDTIAVRKGESAEVTAVAMLHEWEHIQNCGPGDEGDSRRTDPCYPCIHAAMNANSANQLAHSICHKYYDVPGQQEKDCATLKNLQQASQMLGTDTCLVGHCTWSVATSPPATCPNCP